MGFLFSVKYIYLFLWCFLWLKIVKNCQKLVYMGMGEFFLYIIMNFFYNNLDICVVIIYFFALCLLI